jgi:CubicO group peptidase (beta-lactamase class C family)
MIILAKWVESITKMRIDSFVDEQFYKPMGLTKLSYLPIEKGLKPWILPTGIETEWPRGTIRGVVHDPSAALLGGISGNAGLFGNSRDLAKIFQMLLDEGEFQDKQYLSASTVKLFTKTHYNKLYPTNYRGLGFDKPNGYPNRLKSAPGTAEHFTASNVFDNAPESLFGHSGFTGTWAWADPETNMVFIFLSNRTYPNNENNTLIKEGIRGKILKSYFEELQK